PREVQFLGPRQLRDDGQSRIRNPGVAEVQHAEPVQTLEVLQGSVVHVRVGHLEDNDFLPALQGRIVKILQARQGETQFTVDDLFVRPEWDEVSLVVAQAIGYGQRHACQPENEYRPSGLAEVPTDEQDRQRREKESQPPQRALPERANAKPDITNGP